MNEIITALIVLVSVFLGAFFQHRFSKSYFSDTHINKLETNACIDFIKSLAEVGFAQRVHNEEREQKFTTKMIDAKTRICIYGKSSVIKAVAHFWRNSGGQLVKEKDYKDFLDMIIEFRKSIQSEKNGALKKDISQVLFSKDI